MNKDKEKQKMEKQETVHNVIKYLNKHNINYLDFDAYNEEEINNRFQQQYITLYNEVIVDGLFKHFHIEPLNNDPIIFNFFEKDKGKWYGVFYEPNELTFSLNKVLNNDFSDLERLRCFAK